METTHYATACAERSVHLFAHRRRSLALRVDEARREGAAGHADTAAGAVPTVSRSCSRWMALPAWATCFTRALL